MSHRCKRTDRGAAGRAAAQRRAFTLVELLCAIVIMLMVVGTLGGLTRTVQQGFEYCDGLWDYDPVRPRDPRPDFAERVAGDPRALNSRAASW